MDLISRNPGLQHISEEIFLNLDHKDILECEKVNAFWKQTLKNPSFWLKKCLQMGIMPESYHMEWSKLIKTTATKENLKEFVTNILMWLFSPY